MLYNEFEFKPLLMLILLNGLNARTKLSIQKVVNAVENAFADYTILADETCYSSSRKMKRPLIHQSKRLL